MMSGSSLKRKQPEQLQQGVAGAEGTAAAGTTPVGAPRFREAPNPAQQTQQPKKHKAPQLEARMDDGTQLGARQGQQTGQQLEASHKQVPQQHAANCRQQQLDPLPRVQQHEAVAANGQMAERPLQPPAVPPLQQQQQQQQASRPEHAPLAAEQRAGAAPPPALHPQQQGQRYATQPPRQPVQQRQQPPPRQQPVQQPAQALPLLQPPRLPLAQVVPWQQPPAVWPTAAAALGWAQPPQQLWEQQQQQQQQQPQQQPQHQAVPVWDPSRGPAWDPVLQQWATVHAGHAQQHAQQHVQQHAQQPQQWPTGAAAAPSHPGLGWQAQAAALQQQLGAQQQGVQQPPHGQPQAAGQGQYATKLQRDVPPGGPAEALLRLAVRICCQRLGLGEHDGKQLGKVLGELDRNWRTSTCGGHSVSVLLKELDRRGLVVTREETSGGKRICYFRNIAC